VGQYGSFFLYKWRRWARKLTGIRGGPPQGRPCHRKVRTVIIDYADFSLRPPRSHRIRGSSRREGSNTPSRLSASPGRFGQGLEAFDGDTFDFAGPGMPCVPGGCNQLIAPLLVDERPSQVEVTMERNSFNFLQYVACIALIERI
jgi:hypothetical protein